MKIFASNSFKPFASKKKESHDDSNISQDPFSKFYLYSTSFFQKALVFSPMLLISCIDHRG